MAEHQLDVTVNGRAVTALVEPRQTLADFLRDRLRLTGTHLGCEHGVCGACTVLADGAAIRSCLVFAVQMAGAAVTTVEGLTPDGGALSDVQEAFRSEHGLQCGFCTPGFVVSVTAFLAENPDPPPTRSVRGYRGTCAGAPATRASSARSRPRPAPARAPGSTAPARARSTAPARRPAMTEVGATAGRFVGARVQRLEDPRLLAGRGNYIDDHTVPGMLHASFVRSPVARGSLRSIDVCPAAAMPGVAAVFTMDDFREIFRRRTRPSSAGRGDPAATSAGRR